MALGPTGDSRRRVELPVRQIPIGDLVSGVMLSHQKELRDALPSGVLPEHIRSEFLKLDVGPREALLLCHDEDCRRVIGSVFHIPQLRMAGLSLELLHKVFSKKGDGEAERIIQTCELLLSQSTTAPIGVVIVQATLYSNCQEVATVEQLRIAVQAMKKGLSPEAFDNWSIIAAQCLLWGYRSPLEDGSPAAYMKAAQLSVGCFGALEDPQTRERAIEIIREYVPPRDDTPASILSYPVPTELWDGFSAEAQRQIVRQLDVMGSMVPWMREVLTEVKRGFHQCLQRCSVYRSKQLTEQWRPQEFWVTSTSEIQSGFAQACSMLTEVSRFFALCVEHLVEDQLSDAKQRRVRTKLQGFLSDDIVEAVQLLCACLSESQFELPFMTPLSRAVTELLEKLDLPLDISMERSERDDTPSFYARHILPAFRHLLAHGDIDSALNLRTLFPLEMRDVARRDTIDQFIGENQPEVVSGVTVAIARLARNKQLGPDHERQIEVLRSAILYLVNSETALETNPAFCQAIGGLLKVLIEHDSAQQRAGMPSHWGCIQAGMILQRLKKNPQLQRRAANLALGHDRSGLLRAVSECIAQVNNDPLYGHYSGQVSALWDACIDFRDVIPLPKVRLMSGSEVMQGHIHAALEKWRAHTITDGQKESQLPRHFALFLDADNELSIARDASPSRSTSLKSQTARDAHGAMMLKQWEMRLQETGEGLFTSEYRPHALHLLRDVRGLMKNSDSAAVTEVKYQVTFAELFVGLVRGGGGLEDAERLTIARYLGRMLKSPMGASICSTYLIRLTAADTLLQHSKRGLTHHASESIQKILKSKAIRQLLEHWGFEPAE